MNTTIKHRSLQRLGYILVEENHILVVTCDGRVIDFREVGYTWLNPLTEYALKPIYLGYRSFSFTISTRSCDGIPLQVDLIVGATFDPRKAHDKVVNQLAQAAAESDDVLTQLMRHIVGQTVRTVAGAQTVEALCSGRAWQQTELSIRRLLRTRLMQYGIRLAELDETQAERFGSEAVTLIRIHPPASVEAAIDLVSVRNMIATHFKMPATQVENWLLQMKMLEQLAIGGNPIHLWSSADSRQPGTLSAELAAQLQGIIDGDQENMANTINGEATNGFKGSPHSSKQRRLR